MMLLWFLLLAGGFVLMMRFGCGAHMAHAGHGRSMEMAGDGRAPTIRSSAGESTAVDPVCGMAVPVDQGYAEVYQRRLLRFCSRRCLDTFDAAPHRFAS